MQSAGLLLLGIGLLAWPRLHPLDSRRRLLIPTVLIGVLMALISLAPDRPGTRAQAVAGSPTAPAPAAAVPDVRGMAASEAEALLDEVGVDHRVVRVCGEGAETPQVRSIQPRDRSSSRGAVLVVEDAALCSRLG